MKRRKVCLPPLLSNNVFFPSPDEFMKAIGISPSPRNKLKMFYQWLDIPSPLSNSSLDNLGNKGIKEVTFRRAIKPLHRKLYSKIGSVKQLRSHFDTKNIHYWDSGYFWMPIFEGIRIARGDSTHNNAFDFTPIETLIKIRHQQNQRLVNFIRKTHSPTKRNVRAYFKLMLPMTQLDSELYDEYFSFIEKVRKSKNVPSQPKESYFLVFWDFYLSFIAGIDHCIVNQFEQQKAFPNGLFSYLCEQKGNTFLDKLIYGLKQQTNKSYSELAECIPLSKIETDSGRSLKEAQVETLKSWRSGKQLPSYKKLYSFLERINPDVGSSGLQIVAFVCLGLERFVIQNTKTSSERNFARSIFASHYKKHFEEIGSHLN